MQKVRASIALLAGGQSRRLGRDKALERLHDDGPRMLERIIETGRQLTDDLFIVAPGNRAYDRFGVPVVEDRYPGEGPMGGLITALGAAKHPHCLLLGCDYPFLSLPLLRWMLEIGPNQVIVVPELPGPSRQNKTMRLEVLQARYATACLPELKAAFEEGERQLSAAIERFPARRVDVSEIVRFDPGLRTFLNINRQEDLDLARAIASHMDKRFAADATGAIYWIDAGNSDAMHTTGELPGEYEGLNGAI